MSRSKTIKDSSGKDVQIEVAEGIRKVEMSAGILSPHSGWVEKEHQATEYMPVGPAGQSAAYWKQRAETLQVMLEDVLGILEELVREEN